MGNDVGDQNRGNLAHVGTTIVMSMSLSIGVPAILLAMAYRRELHLPSILLSILALGSVILLHLVRHLGRNVRSKNETSRRKLPPLLNKVGVSSLVLFFIGLIATIWEEMFYIDNKAYHVVVLFSISSVAICSDRRYAK